MPKSEKINRLFSVAPMMAWTDTHCRSFHRLISPSALLYTVMITSAALKYGKVDMHMAYDEGEHPVALQLGGNDPEEMALAAKIAEQYGYDEININCGCPSDRVQKGAFGACLMANPETVGDCVDAMKQVTDIPITVKTRIGIDKQDEYGFLTDFIEKVSAKGCDSFTIHARKAWLNGLSPKENRDIPPLDYPRVYQLKKDFSHLEIVINGGILTLEEMQEHLKHVDGVMVGREAYQNPWLLKSVEDTLYNNPREITQLDIALEMSKYAEKQMEKGVKLRDITKHMLGLYQNCPGARAWRRELSVDILNTNNPYYIYEAAQRVEKEIEDRKNLIAA